MSNNEIPEVLEANTLKAVTVGNKDGKLIVNDIDVINRITNDETRINGVETCIANHTSDLIGLPARLHLRETDIETLNEVKNKADKSDVADIKTIVDTFTSKVDSKAENSDLSELSSKAITYTLDETYPGKKIIEQSNVTILNNDFTITNGNLNMVNGYIYLDSSCSNIEGHDSYVSVKDLNANNLITATGNGIDGSKGDVVVDRGGDGKISLWDHVHNNIVHITQEERNRWNNNSATSFVIVPGDEEGKPVVEEKNQNTIYLVLIPDSSEPTVKYTKWIWIKQPDESMNWEKIGSASIDLSEYAKITYVNNKVYEVVEAIETHAANTVLHITGAERTKWNSYENFIAANAENIAINTAEIEALKAPHFKIVDVLPQTGEINVIYLVPKAGGQEKNIKEEYIYIVEGSVGKWEKIGDTEIDLSEYATKEQLNAHTGNEFIHLTSADRLAWNNKVDRSGDTMTGTLNFSAGYIKMPFANMDSLDGHILLGGVETDKMEYIDASSSYIEITSVNTENPNAINTTVLSSDYIRCEVGEFNSRGEIVPVSVSLIEKNGNILASTSVNSNTLSAYSGNTITSNSNFKIINTAGLFVNTVQPTSGNKVLFTKIGGEIDITVSGTSKMTEDAPIVQITSNEDEADVTISGESVYGHIKNPHLHLTDDQLKVLNAAENGCFAYGPVDPDASRPEDPYKLKNPKLLLKQINAANNYGEASLQVGTSNQAYVEVVNTSLIPNTVSISSGYERGKTIEVTDSAITLKTANPSAAVQNANIKLMGDTAIGDSTTNYTFTVNGKDIAGPVINFEEHVNDKSIHVNAAQKAALDERQIDDYTNKTQSVSQFGNVITAGVIDRAFVGTKNIIASLTLKTAGDGTIPGDERKLAIYACNASTLPARIAENGKLTDTTTCRFIGLSDDTNVISNYNTEYTWHFENLKLNDNDKFIIFSIVDKNAVLNADDFKHTNIKILTLTQRANEKSVVFGPQFGANNNAPYYEIGLCDGYIIENVIKDYKDGKPLINPSSDITLINDSVFNVSNSPMVIIPADITDKLIKSTILFKPSRNVEVESLFSGDAVDNIICHETVLTANKLSIIEVTQVNTRRNKLHNSKYYLKCQIK